MTMRKLVLQMQFSLDGFVAGAAGELEGIFPDFDADSAKWTVEKLRQAGAHVMGSVTYRDMAAYWPSSTEPYAAPMNEIPKIVFFNSLKKADWPETRIACGDLATEISKLKQEPGRDLLAHGGVRFARSLVRLGLVDEYRLIVHPIALGSGQCPYSELPAPIRVRLADSTTFKTGVTANTFEAVTIRK